MALEEKDTQIIRQILREEIPIIVSPILDERFEEFSAQFDNKLDAELRKLGSFICEYIDEVVGDLSPRIKNHDMRINDLEVDNAMIKRTFLKL